MRVTVCQPSNRPDELARDWEALRVHCAEQQTDLLVLPEMPFSPWLAGSRQVNNDAWRTAVTEHRRWIDRLSELGVPAIVGSRPVDDPGPRNRAFVWTRPEGLTDLHDKAYLPEEEGFWEATWYRGGTPAYQAINLPTRTDARMRVGVLLCTEMWFLEHGRAYGRDGAHVVAVPRATPASTLEKWLAGGRTLAVVSGAYSASSAPYTGTDPDADLGGGSWISDPEGNLLGVTDAADPVFTVEASQDVAEAAKRTYPRYVPEA